MRSVQEGGEADEVGAKESGGGAAVRVERGSFCGAEGNPAKLKLCLMRGRRCGGEGEGGAAALEEEEENEEEREKDISSSPLWTKWQRTPYGQKPMVWKVRHGSVLYFGCRFRSRSSSAPCAN